MQTLKRDACRAIFLLAIFLICCLIMVVWGSQMNSGIVVIPFMAVWGLSALLWPAFALRTLRAYIRRNT